MAKMFDMTGRRGMNADQWAPHIDDIISGKRSVKQLAAQMGVEEITVRNHLQKRKRQLAAEAQRSTCPEVAIIGTVFWVSLDRKTWRIAEADGAGGFVGIGWSVKNGALYQSKAASVPNTPDKRWKAK
jgi:hypothetical protein